MTFKFMTNRNKKTKRPNQKKKINQTISQNEEDNAEASNAVDSAIDKVFDQFEKVNCRKPINDVLHKFVGLFMPVAHILCRKEQKASEKMADFIGFLDSSNEKINSAIKKQLLSGKRGLKSFIQFTRKNKKKVCSSCVVAVIAFFAVMMIVSSLSAFEYSYNGTVLGVVKERKDVLKTIDTLKDKLKQEQHAEINIDPKEDIGFHRVLAMNHDIDNREEVLNRLTHIKDIKAKGFGIFVNESLVAILESEASANQVLEEIKQKYVKDDSKTYKRIGFSEHVTVDQVDTKLGNIQNKEDAIEFMLTGAVEKKIHKVKQGETLSSISKLYGLKINDLVVSNPGLNPDKLQIDQELSLTKSVPVATVQTVEVATYKETIAFEIAYEDTKSMYKGEQVVKSKGSNGEREITAEIVRNNGIEISRKELESTILSAPVSQVVLVGTKQLPPLVGTGNFVYPVRGRLTSGYGTRWGRLHSGIDLATAKGTKIVAADGGKVIAAGYNGSLGYMVKIDHGGGKVSLYGHCSKLFVKIGQRVYQGQHIANVGNTGRSTGPHLHFEIIVNGKTKNPLNYL